MLYHFYLLFSYVVGIHNYTNDILDNFMFWRNWIPFISDQMETRPYICFSISSLEIVFCAGWYAKRNFPKTCLQVAWTLWERIDREWNWLPSFYSTKIRKPGENSSYLLFSQPLFSLLKSIYCECEINLFHGRRLVIEQQQQQQPSLFPLVVNNMDQMFRYLCIINKTYL